MEAVAQNIARAMVNEFATILLERVAADYSLDFEELKGRYLSQDAKFETVTKTTKITKKKVEQESAAVCTVITAKNTPCKFSAVPGTCRCTKHSTERAKSPVVEEKPCTGVTAKGGPCKFVSKAGCGGLCGTHFRKLGGVVPEEPKKVPIEVPKVPKKVIEVPKPNTPEETTVSVEELLPDFDMDAELKKRMAAILSEAETEEEDEDEEEDEEEEEVNIHSDISKLLELEEEEIEDDQ